MSLPASKRSTKTNTNAFNQTSELTPTFATRARLNRPIHTISEEEGEAFGVSLLRKTMNGDNKGNP